MCIGRVLGGVYVTETLLALVDDRIKKLVSLPYDEQFGVCYMGGIKIVMVCFTNGGNASKNFVI